MEPFQTNQHSQNELTGEATTHAVNLLDQYIQYNCKSIAVSEHKGNRQSKYMEDNRTSEHWPPVIV